MTRDVALSVLIPAWDEEQAIGSVVRSSLASCHRAGVATECLVAVDPRTTDHTAKAASQAGARLVEQRSHGLTAAVLELAASALGPICVVMDGDGQHDGEVVPSLAEDVLTGEVDLVLGGRDPVALRRGFAKGLSGVVRYLGARLLGFLARTALWQDIPDPLTGMFACRRADLLALSGQYRTAPPGGYKLLIGLLAIVPAVRVQHLTVPFLPRQGGNSKLGARVVVMTIRQLVGLWFSHGRSVRRERTRSRKPAARVANTTSLK